MRAQTTSAPTQRRTRRTAGRLRRLVLGGAFAALLALGAVGADVQGDPSQWGVTAGDPSQWGMAGRPTTSDDPQTALNYTKIEHEYKPQTALNFPKITYTYTALNFAKSAF
jgi:hypothetical protein